MRLRERCIQKRSHFSQKSEPYMNRSTPSLPLLSLSGAQPCAVVVSRASRTSEQSQSTTATRRAWISPMQSTLWPTASRRTRRGRCLLRVIFRTKEIGSGNKNILIARLGRLGSESETERLKTLSPKLNVLPAPQCATQIEELAGSRLATSAQPPRTTSPFYLSSSAVAVMCLSYGKILRENKKTSQESCETCETALRPLSDRSSPLASTGLFTRGGWS